MGTPGHKLIQFPERKPGLMQEEESQFSNLVLWLITELSGSLQHSSSVPFLYSVVVPHMSSVTPVLLLLTTKK